MKFSDKLRALKPYTPSTEVFPIRLDANESPFPPPEELQQDMRRAMEAVDLNRYPDAACTGLRRAAGAYYGVPADCVACGCGSDELLSILSNAFLSRGDAVVLSEPDFSMYAFYAHHAELRVVNVPKDDNLYLRPDALIAAAHREKAGMLLFSNPCNPTGQGIPAREVLRITAAVDCLCVVDEAYMDFWDQSVLADAPASENLLVLRTCSKAFGLAALRLGFAVGNPQTIEYVNRARSPYNINALTQAAAAVALSRPALLNELRDGCVRRAAALREALRILCRAFPGPFTAVDTVTNFALLRGGAAPAVWEALKARGILVRLLEGRYLRVTAGSEAENSLLLAALEDILRDLPQKEAK